MRWSRLSEPAGFAARRLAGNVETDPRRVVALPAAFGGPMMDDGLGGG